MQNIEKIIEEFIESHKKIMINPKEYWFLSSYIQDKKEIIEKGWLFIENGYNEMRIVGKINNYNYDKYNEDSIAEGFIEIKDDLMIMKILKIPVNVFSNIYYYKLKKTNKNNDIFGYYKGELYQLHPSGQKINKKKITKHVNVYLWTLNLK